MSEHYKKPFYKKWWVWVIAVLILGAIGASLDNEESAEKEESKPVVSEVDNDTSKDKNENNNKDSNNSDDEKSNNTTEEKTEYGMNEKVEIEGRVLEVTNVERSSGGDFDKPKDGHEYIIVTVVIENNSENNVSYNPFYFKMKNSQGQITDQAFTIVNSSTALSSGELAAGGTVTGTIAFEQPTGDEGLQLIFEPEFWTGKQVTINLK